MRFVSRLRFFDLLLDRLVLCLKIHSQRCLIRCRGRCFFSHIRHEGLLRSTLSPVARWSGATHMWTHCSVVPIFACIQCSVMQSVIQVYHRIDHHDMSLNTLESGGVNWTNHFWYWRHARPHSFKVHCLEVVRVELFIFNKAFTRDANCSWAHLRTICGRWNWC